MKFHIRNLVLIGLLVCSVDAAPTRVGPKSGSSGVLVFQRSQKLEAADLRGGAPFVLRDSFLRGEGLRQWSDSWKLSPDGSRVAFCGFPRDVDFFSAASWRSYVWTAPFNGKPRVVLAAYGLRAQKRDYTFADVSWNVKGSELVVSRKINGNYPEAGEVALYDARSRREVWNSGDAPSRLFARKVGIWNELSRPGLSPDGKDLVCLSTEWPSDGTAPLVSLDQKVAPTAIVHFDITAHVAQILTFVDDQFSVARSRFSSKGQTVELPVRVFVPQFEWQPTQKKFVFVGPASPTDPTRNLFLFDLPTRKLTRLTHSPQDDFCPQWSLDGKQLYWIRGRVDPAQSSTNQIFRAHADGSNPTPVLPQLRGVTRIQLLPKIADWGRYRKLSIEPLAGKDK